MLQDLVRYYEILAAEENSTVPKLGFGTANISFAINIDAAGNFINLTSCKIAAGNKLVAQPMTVPEPVTGRSGTKIKPDFLFGKSGYVLGFDNKGKPDRAKDCFEAFKKHNISILSNARCKEAEAVIRFLKKWDPDKALDHPAIQGNLEEIYKGANFIFRYDGTDVHNVPLVQKAWMEHYQTQASDSPVRQCLVTGEKAPIAILHPSIKGLYIIEEKKKSDFKNETISSKKKNKKFTVSKDECKLVCFNKFSFESYNPTKIKRNGLNAPVSEYATFAYTTALNKLLADKSQKIKLGDTTVVFWAESTQKIYTDEVLLYLDCSQLYKDDPEGVIVRSPSAEKTVRTVLEKIAQGKRADVEEVYKKSVDRNTKFYILGMSLSKTRIVVRFFLKGTFGSFIEKIEQHYEDLAIQKQSNDKFSFISIDDILNETVSKKSKYNSVATHFSSSLMRAVLLGEKYPDAMYQTIILRIHVEKDINYYKASFIKAYLTRKARKTGNCKYEEVLTLSLNENATNKAYLLGRLFAVLDKLQEDANSNVKSKIRDKYFSAASTTPAMTYPNLLKLAQHHLSKLETKATYFNKLIGEIMDKLEVDNNPFPKNLTLDEQGLFYLGYYHQRNEFYKGKASDKDTQQ